LQKEFLSIVGAYFGENSVKVKLLRKTQVSTSNNATVIGNPMVFGEEYLDLENESESHCSFILRAAMGQHCTFW